MEFIKDDITVTIKPIAKKVKFQLKSQTSDKFPEISKYDNIPFFEISSKDLSEYLVKQVELIAPNRELKDDTSIVSLYCRNVFKRQKAPYC